MSNRSRRRAKQALHKTNQPFEKLRYRIGVLIERHRFRWPDGVNPKSLVRIEVAPLAEALEAGDRSPLLWTKLKRLERILTPGAEDPEDG